MALTRSRRRLQAGGEDVCGNDLLSLWFELGGDQWLEAAEDLGSLALVSHKFHTMVASKITCLDLTVAQVAAAQQQLQWLHLHSAPATATAAAAGAGSSSSGRKAKQKKQQQQEEEEPQPGSVLARVASRMPNLSKLTLLCNTVVQSRTLGEQLGQVAAVTQLTCLTLRDACSCALPSGGLAHLSRLTSLQQLHVVLQSTGQRPAYGQMSHTSWRGNITRAMASVSALTQLKHLQLRFICGERGYFFTDALLPIVSPLTQLTFLDLAYIDMPAGGLTALTGLQQLRKCVLYGRLNKLVAQDFVLLQSLPQLQRLEMFHDCPTHLDTPQEAQAAQQELDAQDVEELSQVLAGMQHLYWLNLPMVAGTRPLLPLLNKLPALQQLYLQNIERGQAGLLPLDRSCLGPHVRVLQVDNVRVGREGLDKLADLTQLEQLTLFNLQLNDLGSMQALSALTRLTDLQHFCFDALVADDPQHVSLFDNGVIRALAPCWQSLHSLHISFTALPPAADLDMRALGLLPALQHLSLYASPDAALDQHTNHKPLTIDCSCLPRGLKSLFNCSLVLDQASALPPGLQHLWLSDVKARGLQAPDSTLLQVVTRHLTELRTLVLRLAWPPDADVPQAPVNSTGDLELIASRLPCLTTLGLSLPMGSGTQLVDLRVLSPLTGMKQLLLDYCCHPEPEAAPAAAGAAAAGAQQQQGQQQGQANGPPLALAMGIPPLPDFFHLPPIPAGPPAAAAAAGAAAAGVGPGGLQLPLPLNLIAAAHAALAAPGNLMQLAVNALAAQAAAAAAPNQQQQQQQQEHLQLLQQQVEMLLQQHANQQQQLQLQLHMQLHHQLQQLQQQQQQQGQAGAQPPAQQQGQQPPLPLQQQPPLPPQQQQQQQQQEAAHVLQAAAGVAAGCVVVGGALVELGLVQQGEVQALQAAVDDIEAARAELEEGQEGGLQHGTAAVHAAVAATQALLQAAQPVAPPAAAAPQQAVFVAPPVLAAAAHSLHMVAGVLAAFQGPGPAGQFLMALQPGAAAAAAAAAAAGGGGAAGAPGAAAGNGAGAEGLDALAAAAAGPAAEGAAAGGDQPQPQPPAAAAAAGPAPAAAGGPGPAPEGQPDPQGDGQGEGDDVIGGGDDDSSDDDDDENNNEDGGGWAGGGPGGGPVLFGGPGVGPAFAHWGGAMGAPGFWGPPGHAVRLDSEAVVDQLSQLCEHMPRLRAVWLSDNVLGQYPALPLQQLLALGAPRVTVRAGASDWFWGTNFPIGCSLEGENPLTWWMFTPWSIL